MTKDDPSGTGVFKMNPANLEEGEEFGVGFRKDSDLTAALNEFFKTAYADGTMMAAAETYGVQAAIIAQ